MSVRFPVFLFLLAPLMAWPQQSVAPGDANPGGNTPAQAHASPDSNDVLTPLTLTQALALAAENSPVLKQASSSINRAQAGIQTAKAYSNPSFQFLGGHQSGRDIATPGVPGGLFHYSASQPIELPSERRTRIRASRLELSSAEHQSDAVRLSVIAYTKRAFYDILRRKEQLAYAKDNLALVVDLRRRVQLEVQVGEKGRLELTRAEAEFARAQAAVRSADLALAAARVQLKAAIGLTSGDTLDADGSLNNTVHLQPFNEIREHVLANHPVLMQANAETERAKTLVEHERALRLPKPEAYGEYENQPDLKFYRFGVTVPLPLWDRRKGPIGEAQAELSRTQFAANQQRLEIVAALERAYDQYEISNQQVESLQAGSLREAEAAVEAARNAYKFGERGILEVLDAQRVLQGVRSDILEALYVRQSALTDLEELGATQP